MDPKEEAATRKSWDWVPRPEGVAGLEDWCRWLNFLDGILTAHALTDGRNAEFNPLMSGAWEVSPLLYGSLKFWIFWIGLKSLERASRRGSGLRLRALRAVFWVFALVVSWHVCVLAIFRGPPS